MVLKFKLPSSSQSPLSPGGYHNHTVAQKTFKRLLLRGRESNSFHFSRMHLKGFCRELDWLFPTWKTVMTGRKRKKGKNKLIGLLQFYGWTSLGVSLFEVYSNQYWWNLRASIPGSMYRSPGRLRHDSLLEMKYPGRLRQVSLLRIGSLGRLRHIDFLASQTGETLSRLRCDNLPRVGYLGR